MTDVTITNWDFFWKNFVYFDLTDLIIQILLMCFRVDVLYSGVLKEEQNYFLTFKCFFFVYFQIQFDTISTRDKMKKTSFVKVFFVLMVLSVLILAFYSNNLPTFVKMKHALKERDQMKHSPIPTRLLAYYCDWDCGGWADRLKGTLVFE